MHSPFKGFRKHKVANGTFDGLCLHKVPKIRAFAEIRIAMPARIGTVAAGTIAAGTVVAGLAGTEAAIALTASQ